MNTQRTPKTIFDTPGLCCSLMKLQPNPIIPANKFHAALLAANTKREVVDIMYQQLSATGAFSDMPEGLFDKLQKMRSVNAS